MRRREMRPQGTAPERSRRLPWLRVGPGLLIAVVASVVLWRQSPPPGGPPAVTRTRVEATHPALPTAPDPAWLLEQQAALGLTAPQVRKLGRLKSRWERDTHALSEALVQASAAFDERAAAAGEKGVTVQQLQEWAAPVSDLTRQLAEARRAWWSEAGAVLSRSQRRQAEEAWARRLSPKGGAGGQTR
jgi:hypothetical protein